MSRLWIFMILGLMLGSGACESCSGCGADPDVIARLQTTTGEVQRDWRERLEHWAIAAPGSEFRLGDGVRTEESASAMLTLADGTQLQLPEATMIRFVADELQPGDYALDVQMGEAMLRSGDSEVRLRTHVGVAVLRANSQLTLAREGDALRYSVELGTARLLADEPVDLEAGEELAVEIGQAVLRPEQAPEVDPSLENAAVADAASTGDAGAAMGDAGAATGVAEDDPRAQEPQHTHLTVPVGRSFVVHTPDVPVALAFDLSGKCRQSGVVQLSNGKSYRSRSTGRVHLWLAAGSHRYLVRCMQGGVVSKRVAVRGRVQVVRDAGTRKLPPKAPTSTVEADGRRYTIFYQNQLPNVQVRWPNAPGAGPYWLYVNQKPQQIGQPQHLFQSGSLGEGTHELHFQTRDRRSRTVVVEIRFDNAAPKATLHAPADRAFAPGDTVRVQGVALPTWRVSLEGGTISMDASNRFFGELATSPERPDLVLKLSHPRFGTHYYLRRAKGTP